MDGSSSTAFIMFLVQEMNCGGHFMKNPAVPMSLKEMIKQGKAGNMTVPMDMDLWGFKGGKWQKTLEYKHGRTVMTESERFERVTMPAVEAMTLGISFRFKPFTAFGVQGNAIGNWGFNTGLKTGLKQGLYQGVKK